VASKNEKAGALGLNVPGANPAARYAGLCQLRRGLDRLLVLRPQAWFVTVGPNLDHAERSSGQEGKCERGPEDLTASLALRAVQNDMVEVLGDG
jgi:hypothetical protein